ncbi:hypothetical protein SY83_16780 [Paenibacillus swuensis]|uniref:NmrA-like domain-containing protein n=1 Tax=Paenibacillus swuensis TaxID=1178515 RepID=A0A172TL75_9BACL|nr:SDR family oxidoreductase [Paenibacillus swuensis]ANE47664.1 hypothetical protein SY83_16780 [Paenibacillus swuensis]
MSKMLVTGFTGNVGYEVAQAVRARGGDMVCGVRNVERAQSVHGDSYEYTVLDYGKPETYDSALAGIDRIFLNYPPETEFDAFHAFIDRAKVRGVQHITYLSIKDVQFMPFVPHYKNEKAIIRSGVPYTFVRAGYFMQNMNLFLLDELQKNQRIYVAAGKGKTSFIDVRDIAEVAAVSLLEGDQHKYKKYALTGAEAFDFYEVARRMSEVLGFTITYSNPTIKEFKTYMLGKGLDPGYVNVVTGIHMATKIGLAGGITGTFTTLTGNTPRKLEQYVKDYRDYFVTK